MLWGLFWCMRIQIHLCSSSLRRITNPATKSNTSQNGCHLSSSVCAVSVRFLLPGQPVLTFSKLLLWIISMFYLAAWTPQFRSQHLQVYTETSVRVWPVSVCIMNDGNASRCYNWLLFYCEFNVLMCCTGWWVGGESLHESSPADANSSSSCCDHHSQCVSTSGVLTHDLINMSLSMPSMNDQKIYK